MPRYLIERTFPEAVRLPSPEDGDHAHRAFLENNALAGVTWVHSYIVPERRRSFCLYDAPAPEALRRASERNGLPVDRINEVHMLTPTPDVVSGRRR